MNDLDDRLAALNTPAAAPDDATVSADLRRGRRAATRRSGVRAAATGAFVLAVAGTATAVVTHPHPHPSGIQLVDYTGDQLPGFTIDKVPAGFVLQGASSGSLDIARPDDPSSLDDFRDKVVVTVEAHSAATSGHAMRPDTHTGHHSERGDRLVRDGNRVWLIHTDGTRTLLKGSYTSAGPAASDPAITAPIDVDGQSATLTTNSEGTRTLRYVAGDFTVVVQVWPTLDLTDAQLRDLADGVTVTTAAQLSHG